MLDHNELIKSSVTMEDVCRTYGIEVNRAHKAICPFHPDTKPSMQVYPGRRGWYCFVCNKGGDVIDFVSEYFGLGFREAMQKISDDFGLGLSVTGQSDPKRAREARRLAEQRKAEQNRRNQERTRLQAAYDAALSVWVSLDKALTEKAPDGPLDAPDATWIYAMTHIDQAAYDMEQAAAKLHEFEQRR